MSTRWSEEKAWAWYNSRPWLRGCNYMSADCANRIDQWQSLGFEERLQTTDEELALAAATGFNTIRIILEFIVWDQEHDSFMERFDRYLETAAKHGISCMVVFGNDCMPPKNEFWKPLQLGEQSFDWGYHGGRKYSQHSRFSAVGYHLLDEPELALRHYEWVRDVMTAHRDDERICIWDMYNEPGAANRRDVTMPHLKKFFEVARDVDPIQPLTCGLWHMPDENCIPYNELEQFALDNSDIVSFHCYSPYTTMVQMIKRLKTYGRPMVNTEWLARCMHNTIFEIFPLFYLERIGCYNWGFVAGKYQTYEPWNGSWQAYDANPNVDFDFTKWFHDLYRPNHRPYDPHETELIRKFCDMADQDFQKGIL